MEWGTAGRWRYWFLLGSWTPMKSAWDYAGVTQNHVTWLQSGPCNWLFFSRVIPSLKVLESAEKVTMMMAMMTTMFMMTIMNTMMMMTYLQWIFDWPWYLGLWYRSFHNSWINQIRCWWWQHSLMPIKLAFMWPPWFLFAAILWFLWLMRIQHSNFV